MSKLDMKIRDLYSTLTLLNERLDILIEKYEKDEDYEMCYLLLNYQKLLDTGCVIGQLKEVLEGQDEVF